MDKVLFTRNNIDNLLFQLAKKNETIYRDSI